MLYEHESIRMYLPLFPAVLPHQEHRNVIRTHLSFGKYFVSIIVKSRLFSPCREQRLIHKKYRLPVTKFLGNGTLDKSTKHSWKFSMV